MKKFISILLISFMLTSCFSDIDDDNIQSTITLNYCHFWDDIKLPGNGTDPFPFTTINGDKLNILNLRYLMPSSGFPQA